MNVFICFICCAVVLFYSPHPLHAEHLLFRGDLIVTASSGKLCGQIQDRHSIHLAIDTADSNSGIVGYFAGDEIAIGRLSGPSLARMELVYPFYGTEAATGHLMFLSRSGVKLEGELREKSAQESDETCRFDVAQMQLRLVAEGETARSQLRKMAVMFDAVLAESQAHVLSSTGNYQEALPYFQQALDLFDTASAQNSSPHNSTLLGLGNSYFRLARFSDFNRLYDERFSTVTDEKVRAILNQQRIIVQLHLGQSAIRNGEYQKALDTLLPVYTLNVQQREIIGAIMMAYMKSDRFDDATGFLEKAANKLDADEDRTEIGNALAMINFIKAKKNERNGNNGEAEAGLRKAIELNPTVALYWVALARQQHKAGRFPEAEKLLREGLSHSADEPSRQEIAAALDKMQKIEIIMKSVR